MSAPKGNEFNKKLTSHTLKLQAYEQYLAHLAKGKSKRSWYFEHPNLTLTWETMEKYIAAEPEVFDPIKKQVAWTKGYQHWEEVAELSAKGENKANTPSLQMVMRNKYGWDKSEEDIKDSVEPLIKKLAQTWRE